MGQSLLRILPKIAKAGTPTIYLDQNAWIEFLKEKEGVTHLKAVKESLNVAQKTVDIKKVIFPLSIVHLLETGKRRDKRSREGLAEVMYELSQGWCIIPCSKMMRREISNLACLWAGLPISKYQAVGHGINHIFGQGRGEVKFGSTETLSPEQLATLLGLKAALDQKVNEQNMVLWALKNENIADHVKLMVKHDVEHVAVIEQTRKIEFLTKDPKLRRKRSATLYFGQTVFPTLARLCVDAGLSMIEFEKKLSELDIEDILKEMPSAYTMWLLHYRRDIQMGRPIEQNDLKDIMALSIAIPYCNIVVTEKEWVSIAKHEKLDKLFHTTMLASVADLTRYL